MEHTIKSFVGKCNFKANDDPIKDATEKADAWIDKMQGTWQKVEVISMSTQHLPVGDYAMYVITLIVKYGNFDEGAEA